MSESEKSILWAGFHRGASESLIHACRDDSVRQIQVYAQEAIEAGERALEVAQNDRQRQLSQSEIAAARTLLATTHEAQT